MPRHLDNVRPIIIVRVGGEVHDGKVTDVAIEGIFAEVPARSGVFNEVYTTVDLLSGVDTYDANIIKFLENIQNALGFEPAVLLLTDEVAHG